MQGWPPEAAPSGAMLKGLKDGPSHPAQKTAEKFRESLIERAQITTRQR